MWRKTIESDVEYRSFMSFILAEEDSLSRKLAFDCGHGVAQEEYAMKT